MSVGRWLRSLQLLYFSQPAADRTLFRAARAGKLRSIVELGIGLGGRTQRLLEIASWRKECLPLRYTGIDLFEGGGVDRCGASLKQAFTQLRRHQVQVQLVPGEPDTALRRVANSLAGTDLLLIAAGQDEESLARAWTWVPRMLTPRSLVFLEERLPPAGPSAWRLMKLAEVEELARRSGHTARRAA